MAKYDSRRILTVHELRIGAQIHGGMIAGKCVTWTVADINGKTAFLRLGETLAACTGHDLRELAFYPANSCPVCEINFEVPAPVVTKFSAIPREISSADVPSSFRFRAAQYRGIKKSR